MKTRLWIATLVVSAIAITAVLLANHWENPSHREGTLRVEGQTALERQSNPTYLKEWNRSTADAALNQLDSADRLQRTRQARQTLAVAVARYTILLAPILTLLAILWPKQTASPIDPPRAARPNPSRSVR